MTADPHIRKAEKMAMSGYFHAAENVIKYEIKNGKWELCIFMPLALTESEGGSLR